MLVLGVAGVAEAQRGRSLGPPRAPRSLSRALGSPVVRRGPELDRWELELGAQTSVPLAVGIEGRVRSPVGVTAHLSLGHTPSAYLDMMASMLGEAGVVRPNVRPLVAECLANGVWSVRVGVGYAFAEGLELDAGYTYLAGAASLSPSAIEAALGQRLHWAGSMTVPLDIGLHALHVRVGWRFVVEEHLALRVALGWTHVVAAQARVSVPPEHDPPGGPADRMEEAITGGLGEYGFTPEVLVSAGYRF